MTKLPPKPRPPLPKPVIAMMIAAGGFFFTPLIWIAGLPMEVALAWGFICLDVILVAAIMLFRHKQSRIKKIGSDFGET